MGPIDITAYVADVACIYNQYLSALGVGKVVEGCGHRVNGPYGGLSTQGFTELQQEVIASCDRGNVYRWPGVGTRTGTCGTTRRAVCLSCTRGIRCTCHRVSPSHESCRDGSCETERA